MSARTVVSCSPVSIAKITLIGIGRATSESDVDFQLPLKNAEFVAMQVCITGRTVALHCVKTHRQSQRRSPNFNPL